MGFLQDLANSPAVQNVDPASAVQWIIATAFIAVVLPALFSFLTPPKYPCVNQGRWELTDKKAKDEFYTDALGLIRRGYEKYGMRPFYLVTDYGKKIILNPSYIEAVNSEDGLSFRQWTRDELLSYLPGFEITAGAPHDSTMFEDAVRIKLTQNLPKFTQTLSDEMSLAVEDRWGSSSGDWIERNLKSDVLNLVSRLSAAIFVGPELARNQEWLRISVDFTVDLFTAMDDVKKWPRMLYYFATFVEPRVLRLKAEYKKAMSVMRPVLAARRKEAEDAKSQGAAPPVHNDSIEWFKQTSKGIEYDDVKMQLGLAVAAIHTTSDLLSQVVYNLCLYPEVLPTLREEAARVLRTSGWTKTALYELKYLDSFVKETQRVKPIGGAFMNRVAMKDVTLPGDVKIRKGEVIAISMQRMWDESIYENAATFDPWRFAKRRATPGLENVSHLVSTTQDMTAFSHGKHACPGRFFAANEVKIALVHIILKYDLKLKEGSSTDYLKYGLNMNSNPFTQVMVKRRQEEIDI